MEDPLEIYIDPGEKVEANATLKSDVEGGNENRHNGGGIPPVNISGYVTLCFLKAQNVDWDN